MILECKSCQKKFLVPDNAITSSGRLVQCSSCGNKWTQYPPEKKNELSKKQTESKELVTKKSKTKKKKASRKSGPSIYSKEYLEKKHGIKIDGNSSKEFVKKTIKNKKKLKGFGFYSYFFTILIFVIALFGILNLARENLIFHFPFLEIYINMLYENIENFIILFKDLFDVI